MNTGWLILDSLHVALTTVAIVVGLRVVGGMMLGQVTSELIPAYVATTVVVCTTSSQLQLEAPPATAMVELVCLLSVLTAIHARYFGRMRGSYSTLYAVATTVSLIALGAGAALQAITALPELGASAEELVRAPARFLLVSLSLVAIALAIRGVQRTDTHEQWAGTAD